MKAYKKGGFAMRHKWLFWFPRGMIIVFALFTVVFSFDVFSMKALWQTVMLAFLVHNWPLIFLIFTLRLIWNRPALGSILYYLIMLAFAFIIRSHGEFWIPLVFTVPMFIVATLFLVEYLKRSAEE